MMRLTAKNIRHVTVHELDGIPYSWGVAMKDYNMSSSRCYHNTDASGRSTTDPYPKERLPKEVIKFIDSHRYELVDLYECDYHGEPDHQFANYIIK